MSDSAPARQTADPRRNPSYPQRIHVREKPKWQALLYEWDAKIAHARNELSAWADQAAAQLLQAQMEGARDQLASAVRRMPVEAGNVYDEDKHLLERSVAALQRIVDQLAK